MGSNRLLLVSYYFPPIGGVGVARALSLAKYLPENGFDVHVLTAGNTRGVGKDEGLLRQVPESVQVHRVATLDLPFGVRKRLKNSLGAAPTAGVNQQKPGVVAKVRRAVVQFVKDRFSPDPQVLWVRRATAYASALIKREQIETVLVTTPPYSCLLIGEALKKRFPNIKLVMEFRDEWLTYYFNTLGFNRSELARRKAVEIEGRAVKASDLIVAVTQGAKREIEKRYPQVSPRKFAVIANGFDPTLVPACVDRRPDGDETVITYLGTLYKPTDPTPVVEAITKLPAEIRKHLRLRIIGHVEEPKFRDALDSLGDTVELLPFMPQAEAFEYARTTDYLLVILHHTTAVPAKFYEYLGMGKPVLAVTDPTAEVWSLMHRTKAGWSADWSNVDSIAVMLLEAIRNKRRLLNAFHPNADEIASYDRRNLTAAYAHLLRRQNGKSARAASMS